jgi:hypothetical protein
MLDRSLHADQMLHELEKMDGAPDLLRTWSKSARMIIAGRRHDALALTRTVLPSTYRDPESLYYLARQFALLDDRDEALRLLSRVIAEGFFCLEGAAIDPAFATLWIESGFIDWSRMPAINTRPLTQRMWVRKATVYSPCHWSSEDPSAGPPFRPAPTIATTDIRPESAVVVGTT